MDQDIERAVDAALPEPITWTDQDNPPGELPPLPPGMRWELELTAETEVVRADGTIER